MEQLASPNEKKNCIVSILGTREQIGRKFISMNLAYELANKNKKIIFGCSFKDKEAFLFKKHSFFSFLEKKDTLIQIEPSSFNPLIQFLSFSKEIKKITPEKMEELLIHFPKEFENDNDFLIYTMEDPFEIPNRYILLHTDIHIVVTKNESTIFSHIFQILEKLSFLPKPPQAIYLIFNQTQDPMLSFDSYNRIVQKLEEMNAKIAIHFLGNILLDKEREKFAYQLGKPLAEVFPESPITGNFRFIANKLIGIKNKKA